MRRSRPRGGSPTITSAARGGLHEVRGQTDDDAVDEVADAAIESAMSPPK